MREALSEGLQSPSEIAAWAKARYDVEVTPQMVSAYKSHDKAKSNGTRKGVKRINPGIDLDAVRKVKELVDSIGADEVAELVEVFR